MTNTNLLEMTEQEWEELRAEADMERRNKIGLHFLQKEIDARLDACDQEIEDYVQMGRKTGTHIDYDAIVDMCEKSAKADVEHLIRRYVQRGLPKEMLSIMTRQYVLPFEIELV